MVQANLFIGLGLLSTAYALKLGGWAALLGLAANAAFFATAGKHVTDALANISPAVLVQTELATHLQEQAVTVSSCSHCLSQPPSQMRKACTASGTRSGVAVVKQQAGLLLQVSCRSSAWTACHCIYPAPTMMSASLLVGKWVVSWCRQSQLSSILAMHACSSSCCGIRWRWVPSFAFLA